MVGAGRRGFDFDPDSEATLLQVGTCRPAKQSIALQLAGDWPWGLWFEILEHSDLNEVSNTLKPLSLDCPSSIYRHSMAGYSRTKVKFAKAVGRGIIGIAGKRAKITFSEFDALVDSMYNTGTSEGEESFGEWLTP